MRKGVRIALDLGGRRIGVAKCDPDGILCSPLALWEPADDTELLGLIQSCISELSPIEIVVGLPVDLRGNEARAATEVLLRVEGFGSAVQTPIRLVDERFTTVTARSGLQAAGLSSRQDKARIDAAAASVLLEHTLESERRTGQPPGRLWERMEQ